MSVCFIYTYHENIIDTSRKQGFVYVVEGDGIFSLEGKEIKMLPGTFIYMTENAVHWLKATENTSFLLALVSKD